ncbi:MAG: hypothetical protein ABI742_01265, partial [Gemmatimonadota bacterium]
ILLLCMLPARLTGQQSYPRLARVVGAIRTAALISPPIAQTHPADRSGIVPVLPQFATPSGTSRRRVWRVSLTERLQFRATSDWLASGPAVTLGLGVRF